tara:strand:+ start:1028 stop:2605 length:1578 start_codon:yes stop_codon:yes gene_type:complete
MAEETTAQPRPLTVTEANKPILDITGEQATMGADTINPATGETVAGQFDLGQAEYKPETQTVQEDEKLTTTGKTLTSTGVSATPSTAATPANVSVTAQDAAQVDNVERTYTNLPTTTAQQGTVSEGAMIDVNQVVDERTKTEMFERGSLAEAKTQTLAQEATTKYQVEQLMASLDAGAELPPWAAPAVRKARSIMNARGLSSSSMAAAAMTQAMMESSIPIANADAQAYSRIQLQNLSNEQQTALSNAATIAAMDKQNLDNRMKAAQQNATSLLQMDLTNLTNRQATETLTYQSKVQSLFTDQAAANAAKQFNATSQNQVNQFYDQLGATVSTNNANRESSMNTFNADQTNAMKKYNAKLEDTREQFNSNMQLLIEQANANWQRTLNTANTAEQNKANQMNAQTVLGLSVQAQNNMWQKYRDEASMVFNAAQNDMQRAHAIAITAIANQFTADMFEAQIEYETAQASSAALGGLLTKAFDVAKGVFTREGSGGGSGGATTYYSNYTPSGEYIGRGDYPDTETGTG